MIDSTDVLLEGLIETQLKLKILYSTRTVCVKDTESLEDIKKNITRLFKSFVFSKFEKSTIVQDHESNCIKIF